MRTRGTRCKIYVWYLCWIIYSVLSYQRSLCYCITLNFREHFIKPKYPGQNGNKILACKINVWYLCWIIYSVLSYHWSLCYNDRVSPVLNKILWLWSHSPATLVIKTTCYKDHFHLLPKTVFISWFQPRVDQALRPCRHLGLEPRVWCNPDPNLRLYSLNIAFYASENRRRGIYMPQIII